MKITGYKKADTELEGCMILDHLGIAASPGTLRSLANFLIVAAAEIEEMGEEFDHLHLMDEWQEWEEGMPDIQVLGLKYI